MNNHPDVFVSYAPANYIDNASATCNVIDLKGKNYCIIDCLVGSTDIAMTALKIQEADVASDATTLTSAADVSGLTFAAALPGATDDGKVYRFAFPTAGRKRYVQPVATFDNGTAGGQLAILAYFPSSDFATPTTATGVTGIKVLPAV